MSSRHRQHLAGYLDAHKTENQTRNKRVKGTNNSQSVKKDVPVLFTSNANRSVVGVRPKRVLPVRGTHVRFTGKAHINHLPDELLLKIFSYLDVGDLLISARICKRWNPVASDDSLWTSIFEKHCKISSGKSGTSKPEPSTYKSKCVQDLTKRRNKQCMKHVKKVNPYTGLPREYQKAIKAGGIYFQVCFTDRDDREHSFCSQAISYQHMSICVRWYELQFPRITSMKSLRIFSINPIFFDAAGKAIVNSPYQKSLLLSINIDWNKWIRTNQPTGSDDMINIYNLPAGIAIATWKGDGELAFVSVGVHCNQIIQRCLHGSSVSPFDLNTHKVIPDDIDSTYGLHDYQCTVDIRNHVASLWSQQFTNLSCKRDDIGSGYATFKLIRKDHHCDHVIFSRALQLPWKTDAFRGVIENVVWVDITVLDERGEPFWCASSLCKISSQSIKNNIDFDYSMEERHVLKYTDQTGKLEAEMSLNTDDFYFMTRLDVKLSLDAINIWFDTKYR